MRCVQYNDRNERHFVPLYSPDKISLNYLRRCLLVGFVVTFFPLFFIWGGISEPDSNRCQKEANTLKHLTFPIEVASEGRRGKPASEASFLSFGFHFGSASQRPSLVRLIRGRVTDDVKIAFGGVPVLFFSMGRSSSAFQRRVWWLELAWGIWTGG